jgi:hypothetical protein
MGLITATQVKRAIDDSKDNNKTKLQQCRPNVMCDGRFRVAYNVSFRRVKKVHPRAKEKHKTMTKVKNMV